MSDHELPMELWPYDAPAPRLETVLGQIAGFLGDLGYTKTLAALEKDAMKKGHGKPSAQSADTPLMSIYYTDAAVLADNADSDSSEGDSDSESDSNAESERDEIEGVLVDVEAEETSDDGSSDTSSDSGSDSESDSSPASSVKVGQKRKRSLTASSTDSASSKESSSDSGSDSSSSPSSLSDSRPTKRTKLEPASSPSSSDNDTDSSSSDSDSSSDSGSESASGSRSAKSDSGSDSSSGTSSSDSDSDSDAVVEVSAVKLKEPKQKSPKTAQVNISSHEDVKDGSLSSATLEGDSAASTPADSEENNDGIHPDRLKRMPAGANKDHTKKTIVVDTKKQNVPFSRIPSNQYVDPRFSSNAYVSYDYADKAHQDLVVTKGKGFTKEKNKKKRGKRENPFI